MQIPDQLLSLFVSEVEQRDGAYELRIPDQDVDLGAVEPGETYRVALLPTATDPRDRSADRSSTGTDSRAVDRSAGRDHGDPGPPVEEGETLQVEIEDIGDQGDGITRVDRGFVVIVPDTDQGERVSVEVTNVKENVAFAEVEERISYYE